MRNLQQVHENGYYQKLWISKSFIYINMNLYFTCIFHRLLKFPFIRISIFAPPCLGAAAQEDRCYNFYK